MRKFRGFRTHITGLVALGLLLADANGWIKVPPQLLAACGVLMVMFFRSGVKREAGKTGKPWGMIPLLALIAAILAGCTSFTNHVFRVEQTSTHMAYAAYTGWTNHMALTPVSPQASNTVKEARLKFSASVKTLESLRSTYETNSAFKPQVQAALETVVAQSSNIVWTINYLKQ